MLCERQLRVDGALHGRLGADRDEPGLEEREGDLPCRSRSSGELISRLPLYSSTAPPCSTGERLELRVVEPAAGHDQAVRTVGG